MVDAKGVIVIGHTRRLAALELKMKSFPVLVMRGKSEKELRALRLMDNRVHERSLWDEDALAKELQALTDGGTNLELTGFTDEDFQRLCGELPAPEIAEAPESVRKNAERLQSVKDQRAKGNAGVIAKSDTEHYLVIVYPDRAARENAVKRLGLPPDERYIDSAAVEVQEQRVGGQRELQVRSQRKATAAPANKAGATG